MKKENLFIYFKILQKNINEHKKKQLIQLIQGKNSLLQMTINDLMKYETDNFFFINFNFYKKH